MDRIAEWRPVEPAGPDGQADPSAGEPEEPKKPPAQDGWRVFAPAVALLSICGLAVAGAIGLVLVASVPSPSVEVDAAATTPPSAAASIPAVDVTEGQTIVVDVQGAVEKPGVWRLPVDSRVGDAIEVAGGYSTQVDIAAAARQLNLAAELTDGQQVHVPSLGESEAIAANPNALGTDGSATTGTLININSASETELDTLPGIGPVTAAKIISARAEAPFESIDELQSRDVLSQSVLDKIRELITIGP